MAPIYEYFIVNRETKSAGAAQLHVPFLSYRLVAIKKSISA